MNEIDDNKKYIEKYGANYAEALTFLRPIAYILIEK